MLMAPTSNDVLGGGVGALGTGLREASSVFVLKGHR